MNGHREALILATIQIALVASLGVIMLVDRAVRPDLGEDGSHRMRKQPVIMITFFCE